MWPYTVFTQLACGEFTPGASAAQLPAAPCLYVRFKAAAANTGKITLGFSSAVTAADGSTDTTTGLELNAKEDTGFIPVRDLSVFWAKATVATDSLTYWALGVT